MNPTLVELPSLFHSSETGVPISTCLVCEKTLLDQQEYIIEKAFTNYPGIKTQDLVWEFAICTNCMKEQMNEYSKDSERKMTEYFVQNMDFTYQNELRTNQDFDPDKWISKCIIKGTAIKDCAQYQISAQCLGNMMLFERTPFMISGEAMDEIIQLMSNETLGFFNDFRGRYFPPPEDLSPFFKEKDFVLI
ncbi:MAG: hypothetical protein RLN90_09360 [Balneolaceae bacterium]